MSKLNRNQTNPITLEELAGDLALVAAKNGLDPQELSEANYYKLGGKFRSKATWQRKGGFGKIRATLLPDTDKDLKSISSLGKTASYINKLEKTVGSQLNIQELVEESIKALRIKIKPSKPFKKKKKAKKGRHIIVSLNDTHYGALIDKEEVGGLNSYGWLEASRRTAFVATQVSEYKIEKRDEVEVVHVVLNGDLVQGTLHDKTAKNADLMVHQQNGSIHILTHFLMEVANSYPNSEIKIYGLSGNHCDTTFRRDGGGRVVTHKYDSYSNIVYFALSAIFKDYNNMYFHNTKGLDTVIKLPAGNLMVTHGDTLFSKQIGSISSNVNVKNIGDAIARYNAGAIASGKEKIDMLMLGHVHTFLNMCTHDGVRLLISPSMSGIDSFAKSLTINYNMIGQVIFESVEDYIMGDLRLVDLTGVDDIKELDNIIPVFKRDLEWKK